MPQGNDAATMVAHIVLTALVAIFGGLNIVVIVRGVWYIRGELAAVSTGQQLIIQRLTALETLPAKVEALESDVGKVCSDMNFLFGSVREIKAHLNIPVHEYENQPFMRQKDRPGAD